ncbi:TPA: DNA-directed RNA polymerase subunit N [Candidatus Pacearchaeota archaeon]|jgi:DNA-directed RNA polymerase subunit N|nr:DNA-directed RNA polymerase subunit N [Candidatus Pacearchaeota archaeon]
MLIPVRCFSCGKPIGQLWEEYQKKVKEEKDTGKALDDLKLERYCCRAALLGHADLLPEISKFKKA